MAGDRAGDRAGDWAGVLRTGLSMGLAPAEVWRLSVREWRMLTAGAGAAPLGRADLERMAEAWPDERDEG